MIILLLVDYLGVLCAILADLVSGIRKARRRGERCTSSGLRRTVDKIVRYYVALFSMTVIDVMLIVALSYLRDGGVSLVPVFPYLSTLGSLALASIEVKSIFESSDDKGDMRRSLTQIVDILHRLPRL